MTSTEHGALTVRPYRPGDEAQILRTFNLVFRHECGPGFVDRDLATWRWQFVDNPAGTQILLAVAADGTVASQYCAVPQTADTPFGPLRFVHIVDSMTHPDYRQGLQREGLFAQLGRAFTADYDQHGNEIGYGFPVRIAERIGSRLLDYHLLRSVDYLVREAHDDVPPAPAGVTVEAAATIPPEADELWRACLPAVPCAVRRDHRYLHWRYVLSPERDAYERLVARRAGRLCGIAVLRPRHELVPDACSIVDWVCHDDDDETAFALLAAACRRQRDHGRARLAAVFAPNDPTTMRMGRIGATAVPSARWLERRLTYRITGPYVTPALLSSAWRYTLGDTDLC